MRATWTRPVLVAVLGLVALAGAGLLWSRMAQVQAEVAPSASVECPASTTTTEHPENDNTAAWSRTWYRSPDGRIWASAPGLQSRRADGDKVLWVKPTGSQLYVEGRRLDGEAPPLQVEMPCCYAEDFQASGVTFPTAGCWEIEASTDGTEWRFVVHVPQLR